VDPEASAESRGDSHSHLVDLADPRTWPAAVAALLGADPSEELPRPRHDSPTMRRSVNESLELQVRALMDGRSILMYHATRLIPAEVEVIRAEGLRLQTLDLRREKLHRLVAGGVLTESEAALWEQHGPVFSSGHEARTNELCVVAPIQMFSESAEGFVDLLHDWGGESLAWAAAKPGRAGDDSRRDEIRSMLNRVNSQSAPAVVEVAIPPADLPRFPFVIEVMSARLSGHRGAFNEWHLHKPALQVLDIIQRSSARWQASWFRRRPR
jgi:hypothetical protein